MGLFFRLLLHGEDGAVPILTPQLLRQSLFCDDDEVDFNGNGEGKGDVKDSTPLRRHLILGVAVKDTAIVPFYDRKRRGVEGFGTCGDSKRRNMVDAAENNERGGGPSENVESKRKRENGAAGADGGNGAQTDGVEILGAGDGDFPVKKKQRAPPSSKAGDGSDETRQRGPVAEKGKETSTRAIAVGGESENCGVVAAGRVREKKKPMGYGFSGAGGTDVSADRRYLRVPSFLPVIVVPTFSLCRDALDHARLHAGREKKGGNKQLKQKKVETEDAGPTLVVHNTKDTISLHTPHGMQPLSPEGYVDACLGILQTRTATGDDKTSGRRKNDNSLEETLGDDGNANAFAGDREMVGLFDTHVNPVRDGKRRRAMAVEHTLDWTDRIERRLGNYRRCKDDKASFDDSLSESGGDQNMSKIDGGAFSKNYRESLPATPSANGMADDDGIGGHVNLWMPLDVECSTVLEKSKKGQATLLKLSMGGTIITTDAKSGCSGSGEGGTSRPNGTCTIDNNKNVAIVGWERLDSHPEKRREALTKLMTILRQRSLGGRTTSDERSLSPLVNVSGTKVSSLKINVPRQIMILAVNDLRSILDAARLGITTIGTDLPAKLARKKCALVWDSIGCIILDLSNERCVGDISPLQPGCACLACCKGKSKSRKESSDSYTYSSNPRFTRAYVHHLVKAREMLAETLLFAHNLYQLLRLFQKMTAAAAEMGGGGLEEFCRKIEGRL